MGSTAGSTAKELLEEFSLLLDSPGGWLEDSSVEEEDSEDESDEDPSESDELPVEGSLEELPPDDRLCELSDEQELLLE
jgi:hypothetical protein